MSQKEIDINLLKKEYDKKSYQNIYDLQDQFGHIRNTLINKITDVMEVPANSRIYDKVEEIIYDVMNATNKDYINVKRNQYTQQMEGLNTVDVDSLFDKFSENKELISNYYNRRAEKLLEALVEDTNLRFKQMLDPNRDGMNSELMHEIDKIMNTEYKDRITEHISEYDSKLDGEFSVYLQEEIDKIKQEEKEQENPEQIEAENKEDSFESMLKQQTVTHEELAQNDFEEISENNENQQLEIDSQEDLEI